MTQGLYADNYSVDLGPVSKNIDAITGNKYAEYFGRINISHTENKRSGRADDYSKYISL